MRDVIQKIKIPLLARANTERYNALKVKLLEIKGELSRDQTETSTAQIEGSPFIEMSKLLTLLKRLKAFLYL